MMFVLAMCDAHRRPVAIENDTGQTVKFNISGYKIIDRLDSLPINPGEIYGAGYHCSKAWEFAYLSTASYPDFVAYRFKDICDFEECSCTIRVSELERRRRDLSVPWRDAGSIFPPGAKR